MSRLYGFLLRLLPREFTPHERADMADTFEARRARAASGGALGGAAFVGLEILDLLATIVRSHVRGSGDMVVQDARVGLRSLRSTPITSAVAVISLGVGIGASTAILGVVDVLLLRSLPVPAHEQLLRVSLANRESGVTGTTLTSRHFELLRSSGTARLTAYRIRRANVTDGRTAVRATILEGTTGMLDILDASARIGRLFTEDDARSEEAVVLLTERSWTRDWGEDPSVVGRSIRLDGTPHTVVGVVPDRYLPWDMRADAVVVLTSDRTGDGAARIGLGLARPTQGTTPRMVREDFEGRLAGVSDLPGDLPHVRVQRLGDYYRTGPVRPGSALMSTAVLLVLLIASANIANLMLVRGIGRAHEVAVRGTLGASRPRIARQLLTEHTGLALLGGLLGVLVASGMLVWLSTVVTGPSAVPGLEDVRLDGRTLFGAGLLTAFVALAFGVLPAVRASRVDLLAPLRGGGTALTGPRRARWSRVLVAGQVAMSIGLLSATATVVRSYAALVDVDVGFRTDSVLTLALHFPEASYPDRASVSIAQDRLLRTIGAVPGVVAAGAGSSPPVGGHVGRSYTTSSTRSDPERTRSAWYRSVSPAYADVLDLRVVSGRWISDEDGVGEPRVAVVSRAFADLEWGEQEAAIGETVTLAGVDARVVGVVDAGRMLGPQTPEPNVVFTAGAQDPARTLHVVARTDGPTGPVVTRLRAAVAEVDPGLSVFAVSTVDQLLRDAIAREALLLRILAGLGLIALALALLGVYAMTAHRVLTGLREFGLRAALGASPNDLVGRALRSAGLTVLTGCGLGLVVSTLIGALLSAVLEGTDGLDLIAVGAVLALMLTVSALAAGIPARRAAASDPVTVLQG